MDLQDIRKSYAGWAPVYDATHAWTLPYRREARLALGVRRGDHVLDLACGTGLNFRHLQALSGEQGRVTGVDLSPAMLAIAQRRIARHGWANVETREADAAQLPFPDGWFDTAICTFAMSIIPDYAQAIAEAGRVLAPGGRFVVLDVRLDETALKGALGPLTRAIHVEFAKRTPMHVCGVDITHQTVDELRRVFASVQIREHWAGFVFIAEGEKGS